LVLKQNLVMKYILHKKLFKIVSACVVLIAIVFLFGLFNKRQLTKIENIEFVSDGAWCWFQSPSAVQFNGKTYVGWINKNGDIMIGVYDENTKNISSAVLHAGLQIDDHAAPSILVRPDGRLMIFYSAHNGSNMFYRISTSPEDISFWGEEKRIDTNTQGKWGYTYPNPVQLSSEDNKIYLFWRGGNGEPTFSTSADGNLWSDAQTLFNVPGERPYMKVSSNGTNKVYFTFTDGHPNEVDNNSIYFAYYQAGSFYKANGTFIKNINDLPLTPADVDMVYDSSKSGIKAWNWDIAFDENGYPVIVYAVFPAVSDHRYVYARYNGNNWDNNEITSAGDSISGDTELYYSGGITLNHENPYVVYLSKEIDNVNEIQKWSTQNSGRNWSFESITSESMKENIRPIVPRNNVPKSIDVIWIEGDYYFYTKFNTQLKARL